MDGCYLWSTGSWDVLAIYPESTSSEGSYFDPVVADIIAQHNKNVCGVNLGSCRSPQLSLCVAAFEVQLASDKLQDVVVPR